MLPEDFHRGERSVQFFSYKEILEVKPFNLKILWFKGRVNIQNARVSFYGWADKILSEKSWG